MNRPRTSMENVVRWTSMVPTLGARGGIGNTTPSVGSTLHNDG
jgi:hypothetical protein